MIKPLLHFVRAALLIAVVFCTAIQLDAQIVSTVPPVCGNTLMTENLYRQNPGMQEQVTLTEQRMKAEGQRNLDDQRSATPSTYVIPVVFHIIHNYGSENISDAQVLDAVAMLNEDYRKLNSDASQVVSPFDTIAADCEIEFRLAQLDPNGNCTNGIDRIPSLETNVGDDGSKLNQWPRDKYLNIWVVKYMQNGVAGYAPFPSYVDPANMEPLDGIMILNDYVGRIGTGNPATARTLTHMVAHSLGLPHVGFSCMDGDGIADTPVTSGWTSCQLTNTDVCIPGVPENVQNFMESSYCQRMFTRGQRDLMQVVLNSSVSDRNNLWTTANLILTGVNNTQVTCAPHADFKTNRRMVCEGGTITLSDLSWSNNANSWVWTLTGPDTLTSYSQTPFLIMNTVGTYNVQLVASNNAGSDTITKMNFITVSSDTAAFNYSYSEGFETPNVFYLGYLSNDGYGDGSSFTQTMSVAHTGNGSVVRNVGNSVHGDVDELITPSYFLTYNTNLQFSFVYSYATADSTTSANTPTLRILTSTNCGQSWTVRWTRTGPSLVTAGWITGNFIPAGPFDWDTVVVNLSSTLASPNVRFKFEFTAPADGAANNLYIDDINILSTNVGFAESTQTNSFMVYPNPGDGNATLSYSLAECADVICTVYDVSGRAVGISQHEQQAPGTYTEPLSSEELSAGTYFIELKIGETVSVRKYIVTE
jgi:PKD repeat protein